MKKRLSELRNLGPVTERQLHEIGIRTEADLRAMGSIEAWHRLKFVFGRHINFLALLALEGALLDCDWRTLPPERKAELDRFRKQKRALST
ncbi:TfoX/Sxy family DNA transformation protein [Microvirga flavescens]|uniref:TfoX/Sxy family DNA transformation protein n=1 Tax=Microvirga flavescens TaxID=2249811 RepID=UPI000DDBF9D0|nr:TfoX/Sxy family DNA transformation protein [Microvirga flavescens]